MCFAAAPLARVGLPPAERLLLWGARAWVAGARQRLDVAPAIATEFDTHGAGDAAPLIDALMSVVACGATRCVTIDCLCQSRISPDERRLIQAAALHQSGRGFEACFLLRELLTPPATRDAGTILERIGVRFATASLSFMWLPNATARHGLSARAPIAALH